LTRNHQPTRPDASAVATSHRSRRANRPIRILLTNDDGIYAPGLAALDRELRTLGHVDVVAPTTEQSGVGHSITYLTPLIVKEVYDGPRRWGWAVEGSPADCVRIAVSELCPRRPDLVVSGINSGLNAGINVLYSGTVAAAIEGAFFGITSVAVSLEFDEHAGYDVAARLARQVIRQILARKSPGPQLYNLNIPMAALSGKPRVRVVPMDVAHYGERFQKRTDPRGRAYYWATGEPPPPVGYDLTRRTVLESMATWTFALDTQDASDRDVDADRPRPVIRTAKKKQRTTAAESRK
jgi:5'-nucleotidase